MKSIQSPTDSNLWMNNSKTAFNLVRGDGERRGREGGGAVEIEARSESSERGECVCVCERERGRTGECERQTDGQSGR